MTRFRAQGKTARRPTAAEAGFGGKWENAAKLRPSAPLFFIDRKNSPFRNHHGIAVYRDSEWAERGEITLEAAAQIMDVSVMTALRMVRRGIIKGRQLCRGAPWVIKVEDMAAYREQKPSRRSLTSDPAQQSLMFQ